mmetsp:Transcript_139961/g.247322  ORF Transcript_139961/g.247322 Transcript_139961/m.247322 type:complete len:492 (-) Transcript_139961:56-1531(-)
MARSVSFGLGCLIFMFFSVGICSAEKVTKARLRVSTSDLPSFDQISKRRQIKRHVTNPNENAMQDSVSGLSAATYDHLSAEGAAMALHSARVRISGGADDDLAKHSSKPQSCKYDKDALVVWWYNGIFVSKKHRELAHEECDVACIEAGSDEQCAERADAVVYHLPTHGGGPEYKKFSIGMSMESTQNYPNQAPDNLQKEGYDLVATTNPDSEVPIFYFNLDFWLNRSIRFDGQEANFNLDTHQVPGFQERLPAAAFMARNCASERAELVSKLAEYGVPVHSLGPCAPPGTTAKHTHEIAVGDKVSFIDDYRVYLAFENTVEPGYVSEKIFDGYMAGCVNAYRGAPDVNNFVPPKSWIRVPDTIQDDAAVRDAAQKIKEALHSQSTWEDLTRWRETPASSWDGGNFQKRWGVPGKIPPEGWLASSSCRMCRAAYAHKHPDKALFDKKTQTLQYFRSGSMRGVIIIVMVGVMVMVMAFECFWRLLYFRSVAK